MERIAVTEEQSIELVDAIAVKITAKHSLVIGVTAAIEEPVRFAGAHVNRRAGAEIKRINASPCSIRPVEMFDIIMTARQLREEVHDADDKASQKPIRIV